MTIRKHPASRAGRRARILLAAFPATLGLLMMAGAAAGQDLVVGNARIVDGTGNVIEQGSVVIEDGRIVAVSAEQAPAEGRAYVDAQGMTVLPGLIETHAHLAAPIIPSRAVGQGRLRGPDQGPPDPDALWTGTVEHMRGYLESGFTTVLNTGGHVPTLSRARNVVERGDLAGPRMLFVGILVGPGNHPCHTRNPLLALSRALSPSAGGSTFQCSESDGSAVEVTDAAVARAEVRRFAGVGVDMIKVTFEGFPTAESMMANAVLAAISQEAEAHGLPVIVHAVRAPNALRAVELGADKFVHAPLAPVREPVDVAHLSRTFIDASIPFATTTHLIAPYVDESGEFINHWRNPYNHDPEEEDLTGFFTYLTRTRQAFDAGVTVAFGTDGFAPEHMWHEVETLSRVFAPAEIIRMMTRNAAVFLEMEDEIGTLEPGKLGDLVVIDGDPLADISELANVRVVVREGRIVADNR